MCKYSKMKSAETLEIASIAGGHRPLTISIGMRDSRPPMGKFFRLRCVCAPQYLVLSTSTSPKVSDSVLELTVLIVAAVACPRAEVGDVRTDKLVRE